MEINKDDRILKKEDSKYHDEGDIQDDVKEEINWNIDEGIGNFLDNGEIDNLHEEDVSIDNVKKDFFSSDDSRHYDDFRERDISYFDNPKEKETSDKDSKVFFFLTLQRYTG